MTHDTHTLQASDHKVNTSCCHRTEEDEISPTQHIYSSVDGQLVMKIDISEGEAQAVAPVTRAASGDSDSNGWQAGGMATRDRAASRPKEPVGVLVHVQSCIRFNVQSKEPCEARASELVANAVRHGERRAPLPDGSPPVVWLALTRRPHSLLCVVYDPSRRRPRLTPPAPLAEDHRGLPILEALSEGWGWKPSGANGKAVWARLALPPAAAPRKP
ncbi:ATP-binding protein [Streptomyces rubiginosohelvolus]|uniref:ATP-binding protein n=1 Tax=Streptomyces rubiginosohelvolus TaxID=67362 RepID=UPI0036FADF72